MEKTKRLLILKNKNEVWKVKTRLKLIAVCIRTKRYLSILNQSLNKPLAISALWEEKKVTAVLILFYFISRLLDIPQQDLIKLLSPVYKFC